MKPNYEFLRLMFARLGEAKRYKATAKNEEAKRWAENWVLAIEGSISDYLETHWSKRHD